MANCDIEKLMEERKAIRERLAPAKYMKIQISSLRTERNSLNTQVRALREKIRKKKQNRDNYNIDVKAEKEKRDNLNKKAIQLRAEFSKKFSVKVGEQKPKYSVIKKKVKDLQWRIETSGVSFSEEKKLRNQLEKLEDVLAELQKEEDAKQEIARLSKDAKKHHLKVLELSNKSKKLHQDLLTLYAELRTKRAEANNKHGELIAKVKELENFEKTHINDINRLQELNKLIKDSQKKLKVEKEAEVWKTFKERALDAFEKLKSGKRVDLRDLQLKFSIESKINKTEKRSGANA